MWVKQAKFSAQVELQSMKPNEASICDVLGAKAQIVKDEFLFGK